jgi:integrase
MTARKMKGSWWVDFRFERERVRRRSPVDTRRGAEEYERKLRQQLLDGTFGREEEDSKEDKEKEKVPRLSEFAPGFIAGYARVRNKSSEIISKEGHLRRYIVPVLGELRLDEIKAKDIDRLAAKMLDKKLSKKSVNNTLATLGKLLRYAEENETIVKAPKVRLLKAPKADFDFLDFEEAERLLAAAKKEPEWYALVVTALRTGLRFGELIELRWGDVDLVTGRLMVKRNCVYGEVGTPKSGHSRELPLSPQTVAVLTGVRHLKGDLVFSDNAGKRLVHHRMVDVLRRLCKRAGLRPVGWHMLRHTFASHLVMRGVSLKAVQEMLGHATMEMTMRYSHLSPVVKRDAVNLLDAAQKKVGT